MHQFFVLFALLVLASAQGRRGCCTPRQWEGEVTGFDHRSNTSFFETISYDFDNHRVRIDAFTDHMRQFHRFTVFEEMSRKDGRSRIYFIEDGKCTVKIQPEPMPEACVRDNHHEERHLIIGGELEATWYGFTTAEYQRNVVVSRHHCLPIEGVLFEHHGRQYQFDLRVNYWNVRHGIGNPVIFELPSICPRP